MNLTPRQLDVVSAIRNYRYLHGYSPTMQELADQLGTSKVTIFEHVGALEKKRVIRRNKHKARSLEIISEELLPDEERATKLVLLGNIAAGSPIEAVENREELDLETMFHAKNGVYVLRVRGDSMIDDHLCNQRLCRDRTPGKRQEWRAGRRPSRQRRRPRSSDIIRKGRASAFNRPTRPNGAARIVDANRVKVQGVVIGVLRSYVA